MKSSKLSAMAIAIFISLMIPLAGCGSDTGNKGTTKTTQTTGTTQKTQKSQGDPEANFKNIDPASIDKETLDAYIPIAKAFKLNEQEFRGVVAKLLDVGITPNRIKFNSNGTGKVFSVKPDPNNDETGTDLLHEVRVDIDKTGNDSKQELRGVVILGPDHQPDGYIINNGKLVHSVDQFFFKKKFEDKVYKAVREHADSEMKGYQFKSDSTAEERTNTNCFFYEIRGGVIIFSREYIFTYEKDVYGQEPEQKKWERFAEFDGKGKVIKYTK